MKKKKQQTAAPPTATTTAADTATAGLKSIIHDHALFFDKLVELIPAKFYIPTDDGIDSKPWFQGLSKVAKASAKQQTRENIKKARRDRLDPEKSHTTTLDLLKQNIAKDNAFSSDSDEEEEIEIKPIRDLEGDSNNIDKIGSVTYEELQQRLHCKLEELRANRGHGKRSMMMNERREMPEKKQKRSDDDTVEISKDLAKDIEFGKVQLGDEEKGKKMKGGGRVKELERAKKLQEAKKDPVVATKHLWMAATSRAMGVKVHDDPKLLKKSIHKDKKRHEKNVGKWKERVESRDKLKVEKQQKRAGNIAERAQQKKMRKLAKREKKLMRPGFEGRKEGYIGAQD